MAVVESQPSYYYSVLQGGHKTLCLLWILSVTLLGMGGLLREKSAGVSSFTLALPVSRVRLMSVRIAMGSIQALALAVIPSSAMFITARITGKADSVAQLWFHLFLLVGGGTVFFGLALLVSSLVEGEYTAPVVSFGIVIVGSALLSDPYHESFSPWEFIAGSSYLDGRSQMLVGPLPWMHVAVTTLLALVLLAMAVKAIQRREF
jgi:ABC-2 type transport system permease protein